MTESKVPHFDLSGVSDNALIPLRRLIGQIERAGYEFSQGDNYWIHPTDGSAIGSLGWGANNFEPHDITLAVIGRGVHLNRMLGCARLGDFVENKPADPETKGGPALLALYQYLGRYEEGRKMAGNIPNCYFSLVPA